jgi:hypothetical protein
MGWLTVSQGQLGALGSDLLEHTIEEQVKRLDRHVNSETAVTESGSPIPWNDRTRPCLLHENYWIKDPWDRC